MRKLLTLASSILLLAGAATGAAQAAPPKPASYVMAQSDARAEVSGMTVAQATELQAQIDDQLRKSPGGTQISATEISWNGGNVVMEFPVPGQKQASLTSAKALGPNAARRPAAAGEVDLVASGTCYDTGTCQYQKCPYGWTDQWYCLYQDSDWGGRRLQWKDHYPYEQTLDTWNFSYQASGWVNTSLKTVVEVWGPGGQRLWFEPARDNFFSDPTHNSFVGWDANDKATSFTSYGDA
ncbi:hypothetical protein [Kitasatospora sp. NPDC059673]|uniref:hypothetical protein n=1 Tax=Kitasatospora sp. NPDC059673 TaxID=3346901 RepID=UPI0036955C61